MRRLLLIDANTGVRDLVQGVFDSAEIDLAQTDSFEQGLKLLREIKPEIVIMGFDSNDRNSMDALRGIGEVDPKVPVIVVEPAESTPHTLSDLKTAVFDRLNATIDPADLARAMQVALTTVEDAKACALFGVPVQLKAGEQMVVGHNLAMKAVFKGIERLAHSEAFAVVTGERGTGKKLIARSIHQRSRRRDGFMVVVDCAEAPELLDRELFGENHRKSRLELAVGGTLFLHHIEQMPLTLQNKLLSWLQEQPRSSVLKGSDLRNVRLLASTTLPLEQAVAARTFREDLFRNLSAVQISLPALRDRLDDLPDLVSYFLNRFALEANRKPKSLSPVVSKVLASYPWPENVRELEQTLQRADSFCLAEVIELGDLPGAFLTAAGKALFQLHTAAGEPPRSDGEDIFDVAALARTLFRWARKEPHFRIIPAMERGLIIQAMAETEGNQAQAARLLGITRATLRKRLQRFNIQREVFIH